MSLCLVPLRCTADEDVAGRVQPLSLTLCLVAVFLALRGVLHPAVPAAQLPGGLPGPGNSSAPGGGMESE